MYQPQVVKRAMYWYKTDLRKQRMVRQVGRQFDLETFVETGTYRGDMTVAAAKVFEKVYSIELHRPFYEKAVERFADNPSITILYGDSGEQMEELMSKINGPTLFWLDAHGGKEALKDDGTEAAAPLIRELVAILGHPDIDQHMIMIDDAHMFEKGVKWGAGVWSELEKMRAIWLTEHQDWMWQIEDDVLRIHKKRDYV